jgi:hypothetical protein
MDNNTSSTLWESAMSTNTMLYIRQTASGVWRTAFILFLVFIIWGLLQPMGLERSFDLGWRYRLEQYRSWIGPFCLLPVLISAFFPARKLLKSPALPGRGVLITLVLMAITFFGILSPVISHNKQMEDEKRCREIYLPAAFALWQDGAFKNETTRLPACPCQWEDSLGSYQLIEGADIIFADAHPFHPSGRLGVNSKGEVVELD